MTAGMSRARRRVRVLGTLAVAASWSVVLVGAAQPAAADTQSKQWYLASMQAEDMWKVTTGEGVKVAVVDTGVNASTPSLRGQVLTGVDVTGAPGDETDDYRGHGTTMAELIAGTGDGGGLKGLAPGAEIIPVRMSDVDFMAKRNTVIGDIAEAIRAAADSDAQIISVSMADVLSQREEHEAVKYAQSKGKLVIAGVGNEGHKENWRQYPAAYPEVVGVASADRAGKVSYYSQHAGTVDVASPGSDIPSWCDNSFKSYCDGDGGTSAATAIASASAALVWSLHPDWTANQVLNVLLDTASRDWKDGVRSKYLGHGLIRPSMNVLKGKGDPGAPDISPLTKEKTTGPAKSSEPSASTSASPQPAKNGAEGEKAAALKESNSSDDGNQLGLILGVAAAVAVLGGVAYAVVRRRKAA
ncbi:S8 family serine peptidase [Streptomyces rubiginosohelvolus]|uniref:S8 family serine peptidase n=1 Tax=unclassified Streptomyces TaxID=2593676 RepID=UPI00190D271A|nr:MULTISPECIES: S8 family serine peptidase [unclassified Streptomyces]MBK3531109.1 S8 family serine peptidase [Streptomyces sp. MBT72]MBK3537325.1 S8 family serine peptidase [Streptomyces sp. MBT67]MBK3550190.1 S8 family serine peptidase [Streptomyces sp. MBT61]MBK6028538.1 S8 family serine peptidase [Streptomyces sp. MBT59]